jgi:transposase
MTVEPPQRSARICSALGGSAAGAAGGRSADVSRPAVWRWQRRYAEAGVAGLLCDKSRPPGKEPVPAATAKVLVLSCGEPRGEMTPVRRPRCARRIGKIVHVILDNYGSHKHPKVRSWLDRHPRFVFHYTPTSASWLNAVQGFFAKLSKRRLKHGVFRSLVDLQAAIKHFLAKTNDNPKPFVWTSDPDKIIAAARRGSQTLDSIH